MRRCHRLWHSRNGHGQGWIASGWINVRIAPNLWEEIRELAEQENRSTAREIAALLREALQNRRQAADSRVEGRKA